MSEQIDYEERLPRQPSEGALDWCIQTKFKSEYVFLTREEAEKALQEMEGKT